MCEFWIYSCNHTVTHTCRAYDPSGARPQPPEAAPQVPNIGYGLGQGFYPGQTGVGENMPPPPIVPGYDPTKPKTAVQVYTKKKAAKHTELLTIPATVTACSGVPDSPRRSENPCFDCLLKEGKEKRAGVTGEGGIGEMGQGRGRTLGDNARNEGAGELAIRERPPPNIIRQSLNDNGAHIIGGKVGRRVKVFSGKGVRQ